MQTTKEKGYTLERKVARALANNGEKRIKTNISMYDKEGDRSEIDVVYGRLFKTYIECKNYDGQIPLKEVSKFAEVLRQNKIPLKKGILISQHNKYSPRCKKVGVNIYTIKEFEKRLRNSKWAKRIIYASIILSALAYGAIKHENVEYNKIKEEAQKTITKKVEESKEYIQDKADEITNKIKGYVPRINF